jgi:hypothetical protein
MASIRLQRKKATPRPKPDWGFEIRVSHKAQRKLRKGHVAPRYLLRCGCCDEKLEIYYDADGLEINGVNGSIANWGEILLPLLGMTRKGEGFVAGVSRRVPKSHQRPAKRRKRE